MEKYYIVNNLEKELVKHHNLYGKKKYELHNILSRYLIAAYPDLISYPALKKLDQELSEKRLPSIIANEISQIILETKPIELKIDIFQKEDKVWIGDFSIPKYRFDLLRQKGTDKEIVECFFETLSLLPSSQQWAIPLKEYEKYVKEGATIEGFASPFNSQIVRVNPNLNFCSIAECDKKFGSLGNFFEQDFTNKFVIVNPPFIESILEKAARKCLESRSAKFVFYGPNWPDAQFYKLLERYPKQILKKRTYSYEDVMKEEQVLAYFDSVVFTITT